MEQHIGVAVALEDAAVGLGLQDSVPEAQVTALGPLGSWKALLFQPEYAQFNPPF